MLAVQRHLHCSRFTGVRSSGRTGGIGHLCDSHGVGADTSSASAAAPNPGTLSSSDLGSDKHSAVVASSGAAVGRLSPHLNAVVESEGAAVDRAGLLAFGFLLTIRQLGRTLSRRRAG